MQTRFSMPPRRHRSGIASAALALVTMFGAHAALSAQPEVDAQASFDAAMSSYERCHWALVFEQLAALADRGHAEAARIALQMERHGPALYATRFGASAQQRDRWLAFATDALQPITRRSDD